MASIALENNDHDVTKEMGYRCFGGGDPQDAVREPVNIFHLAVDQIPA